MSAHMEGNRIIHGCVDVRGVLTWPKRMLRYEINALVVCACGCGEMFPKFDAVGRPRQFVSGHNPPDAPTATAVLKAIGGGQRSRAEIIKAVGASTHAVATCLSKLKRAGRVRRVGHGVWEAA